MDNWINREPKFLLYSSLIVFLATGIIFVAAIFFYHPSILKANESVIVYRLDTAGRQCIPVLKTRVDLGIDYPKLEIKVKYTSLGASHFLTLKLLPADTAKAGRGTNDYNYKIVSTEPVLTKLPANCIVYSEERSSSNLLKTIIKI